MARNLRQSKILELIKEYEIETQEELADLLEKAGYHAFSQAEKTGLKKESETDSAEFGTIKLRLISSMRIMWM